MNRRDFLKASALTAAWLAIPVFPIKEKTGGKYYPNFDSNKEYGTIIDLTDKIEMCDTKFIFRYLSADAAKHLPQGTVYEIRYEPNSWWGYPGVAWYYNKHLEQRPLGIFKKPQYIENAGCFRVARLKSEGKIT